jgi:type I site-specific restriction-modification system R (restriction) subunit
VPADPALGEGQRCHRWQAALSEGRLLRYGSIRMPIDLWGPWRDDDNPDEGELRHVRATVESLMRPGVVLDILQNFTLFATRLEISRSLSTFPMPPQ